jgi:hypothetical protein
MKNLLVLVLKKKIRMVLVPHINITAILVQGLVLPPPQKVLILVPVQEIRPG